MPRRLPLDVLRGGSDDTVASEQPDLRADEGFVFLGECRWRGMMTVRFQKMKRMMGGPLRPEAWKVDPLRDAAGLHRRMTRGQAAKMKTCTSVSRE